MKKQQSGFAAVEIIIVLVVIGVIGGIGWVVLSNRNKSTNNETAKTETTAPASTAESGTCFGVSKATIKSLLGPAADNLQNMSDTGVVDVRNGDKAQTCVYPFVAGATADNSFLIDRGTYANQANLDDSQKYIPATGAAIAGLGDSATFAAQDGTIGNTRNFVLTIRQDLKIYKFEISQPQGAVTFTDASAQEALTKIAQAATL